MIKFGYIFLVLYFFIKILTSNLHLGVRLLISVSSDRDYFEQLWS